MLTVTLTTAGTFTITLQAGVNLQDYVRACVRDGGVWNLKVFFPMSMIQSITAS
jgi:hypothetical protein